MRRMEHLPPQDPIEIYQPQINQNYDTARAYFKARRQAVKAFYDKEIGISIDNLLDDMTDTLIDEWLSDVFAGIEEAIAKFGVGFSGASIDNLTGNYRYRTSIENIIKRLEASGGRSVSGAVQNEFKNFVANNIFGERLKGMVNADAGNAIMAALQVLRGGHRSFRTGTDIAIGIDMDITSPYENNKVLYRQSRSTRAKLSLDKYTQDTINDNELLKNYLMSGAHGFYINHNINGGGSGAVRFIGARAGLTEVRTSFNRRDSHNAKHTWEPEYAKIYTRWVISKELMNILGPFNVALATGTGIIWMDDFLNKTRFDAEVSIDRMRRSTRDGGTRPTREAFPRLESGYITIGDANKILQRTVNKKGKEVVVEINLS